MSRLALRSLLSHPLRTALTTLAILLGVAMISGTYVLTDQISNAFDGIFSTAYEGTAVVVTPKNAVGGFDDESTVLTMPDSLLAQARAVDGVAAAAGGAEAMGAVVVDGELVKTSGAPTLIMSTEDAAWSNVGWTAGAAPARAGEVVVDAGFAEKHDVSVGDEIGLATLHGTVPATVSGIFTFGDSSSLGGTIMVGAELTDVQRWYDMRGELTSISLTAEPGVTPKELAARTRRGAARLGRGQDRGAGRRRQLGRGRGLHQLVPAPGPARLRRRGRLRRRLHHLQRLLDHRRPAAARVRHAARLRRLAAPGADLGHRRGAAPGRGRVGRRSVRRPRRGQGHQPTVQGLRRRLPGRRSRPRAAHRRGGARRRHRHGARRRRRAGGPRHADPAGRRAPGGRDAAAVAAAAASRPRARSSSPCSAPAS